MAKQQKGYAVPPGIPGVMQKEHVFPGVKDPGGYLGSYKKRKKVTAKRHTLQSQKRADRLRSKKFMKKFKGTTRKTILV